MAISSKSNIRAAVILLRFWRGIREWCGDAAYDRYLESCAKHLCAGAVLTRKLMPSSSASGS